MLDTDAIVRHFRDVERAAQELTRSCGASYLGRKPDCYFELNSSVRHESLFSPRSTRCSFRTEERAVSPTAVASILCRAIERQPNISFVGNTLVLAAGRLSDGGVSVETHGKGQAVCRRYSCVANCMWDDRLRVDRTAEVIDPGPWFLRYKATISISMASEAAREIPSATGIVGTYGDVVNQNDESFYVSWYPLCRRAQTVDEDGRKLHDMVHTGAVARAVRKMTAGHSWLSSFVGSIAHRRFIRDSIQAMAGYVPSMASLLEGERSCKVGGGVILAKGTTDIDDPASYLHQRSAIGPVAHGSYVTIDTGKYCMAPLFGVEAADIVAGILR